jgi:hypothetical protein
MAFPLSFQVRSREALLRAPKQVFAIVPAEDLPRVGTGFAADHRPGVGTYISLGFIGSGTFATAWLMAPMRRPG